MPLPTGHTAIGFTIYSLCSRGRSNLDRWKILVGVILLSNLPDVDVIAGLIFRGNGSAFHRGPTHSLLFALVTAILASNGWRIWSRIPKFSLLNCFLIILSHVLADAIFTGSKISFLWPFAVNWSEGCMGWRAVIDAILYGNHLNFKIAVACGLFVYLCRKVRGLQTAATAKGINFDKERVERGQSTENVAVIYEAIADLQKRRAEGKA